MRWDRLFDDLEAGADELAREEAESVAADVRDEWWAERGWRDVLGGRVSLDVRGHGRLDGEVAAVNEQVVQLVGASGEHLVAAHAIVAVLAAERRADPPSRVAQAFGWTSALRHLRDLGEDVRITLLDGRALDGRIDAVGGDFVSLVPGSGESRLVVTSAIAVVSGLR